MTIPETILHEIRQGRNSVRAIHLSQPSLAKDDIRTAVNRLLFRGEVDRVGRGKFAIKGHDQGAV